MGYRADAMTTGPYYLCITYDSDDPAVEANCPEGCGGGSWLDEGDGTMKYYCHCEDSSAEECAEKYPGEQPHRAVT
jgi:hypothetical protein